MSRIFKRTPWLAQGLLKGLIATLALTASACSSLMYYPSRSQFHEPKKLGMSYRDVFFNNEEGTKLHGWYFPAVGKSQGLVVFFHGNAENLSSHFLSLAWLPKEGYDYFIFDYEGYGLAEGNPSPARTVMDGKAAVRWAHEELARQKRPQAPLYVLGQSLGGAIALRSVIELKPTGPLPKLLVADSTFESYQTIGRRVMARAWFTWPFQWLAYLLLSDSHAPEDRLPEISPIPLVVIHGDADETVDYDLGQSLYEHAAQPKEFWPVPGGHHIESFNRPEIRQRFLKKLRETR